tara:strand:+ start:1581 stop:3293 length:1713 start_codon:yes stop_codon:yes gene_type:complete
MEKKISIQFKSTAYRMLKKMPGKLWFIFGEFIDNSISSYLQNRVELEQINGKNFKLRIELKFDDDDEIRITDNAAGIDHKNWLRALQPGDIPEDDSGMNEFGMGMKYSAVWLSNHWTLKSKSINDSFQKIVHFDFHKVISKNLEDLPYEENYDSKITHGTQLILTQLETGKLRPFPKVKTQKHITSIYRNFLRQDQPFFSKYKVDSNIEIIAFGQKLSYEEPGFLKTQWYKDRHNSVSLVESPEIEWKYEFDEFISNPKSIKKEKIRFSGFIGILPEIKQGNNGFSYFRRGRVVVGSGDEKVFPTRLSTNPSSFKYKRLYGEFHFNDTDEGKVESTFNKNAFQDEDFITFCIDSLALILRSVNLDEIPHRKFNLLQQADQHRSTFDPEAAKKTIDRFAEKETKFKKDKERQAVIKKQLSSITKEVIQKSEDELVITTGAEIPNEVTFEKNNAEDQIEYHFKLNYWESINPDEDLYSMEKDQLESFNTNSKIEKIYRNSNKFQICRIKVNLKHRLFMNNESFRTETQLFGLIINTIKCMCYSEVIAKGSGAINAHFLRTAFNKSIDTFLHE